MSETQLQSQSKSRVIIPPLENAVFLKTAVHSVDEAIERMEEITQHIEATSSHPETDGLGAFNYLYTVITKRIREGINTGFFEDRAFLTQLDITFANRYFDALRAYVVDPKTAPKVWRNIVDRRDNTRIKTIQFAAAGVNAHINFDLGIAVVDTCSLLRTEPRSSTQRADYQKVNQIFAEEMTGLRQHYENGFEKALDVAASPILDIVCTWSVVVTRNAAWETAEHLWKIRRAGKSERSFERRLDRLATLGGDFILTPII